MLAGCKDSVVGEGQQPTRFYLGTTTEQTAEQLAECTMEALNAYVVFDGDGGETIGNYSDRVVWSSDNPSIVFVGDGVAESPSGSVYAPGTIIGLRPGVATISATYLDFHASITIDVSEMDQLAIDSDLTHIGEQLDQAFVLKARLAEGETRRDITTSAVWRFDPATSHAYVGSSTGVVHAKSSTQGQPLRLVARLPECDREVDTQFVVASVTSLQVHYERGDETVLPENFSETFTVSAGFDDADAPRQDVTAQMSVESVDDDYIGYSQQNDVMTVTAGDREGSGRLTLSLDALDLQLETKTWQIANLRLLDIGLDPQETEVTYPDTTQLTVVGTFDSGLVMPVTRHVSWSVSDASVASVSSASDDAGEVTITNTDADIEITASITTDDDSFDDSATVHVFANAYAD
jgi:hypothetical protein